MIVACPSCHKRYDLPASEAPADGSVIACAACGHTWLEGRALEVIAAPQAMQHEFDPASEAERIAEAARLAAAGRRERRRQRRAELKGWAILAAVVAAPLGFAMAAPEAIVRAAPAAARLYAKAGIAVNIRGFEIRNAQSQLMLVSETRVLAVRGELVNVSSRPLKVPSMRFLLRDPQGREIYAWTLAGVGNRPLAPGESTSFLSRLASPPTVAEEVEIRFARDHEIGSNAGP